MKDVILHKNNRFTWFLLAFQGGLINIAGYLSVHQYVSHLTGTSGNFAMAIFGHNLTRSLFILLIPISFISGSFFSATFTEVRRVKGKPPIYVHALLTIGTLYLILAILGNLNFFGVFGEPFTNNRDIILLIILSFSCGSQNALFTYYSKSIIRTTHLTGLATDLGVGLAKQLIVRDETESKFNLVRFEIIFSFFCGSIIGVFAFQRFHFSAFIIATLISYFTAGRLFLSREKSHALG